MESRRKDDTSFRFVSVPEFLSTRSTTVGETVYRMSTKTTVDLLVLVEVNY